MCRVHAHGLSDQRLRFFFLTVEFYAYDDQLPIGFYAYGDQLPSPPPVGLGRAR